MNRYGLFLFHCITPLHNGAGQGLAGIDRPILREVTTGFPYVQSSTLKGALRARCLERGVLESNPSFRAAFGSQEGDGNQGCALLTQADILLFPVRSLAGTFAWVTSPLVLARLRRLLGVATADAKQRTGAVDSAENPPPRAPDDTDDREASDSAQDSLLQALDAIAATVAALGATRAVPCRSAEGPLDQALLLGGGNPARYGLENLVLERASAETVDRVGVPLHRFAAALAALLFSPDEQYWPGLLGSRLLLIDDGSFDALAESATQIEPNIRIGKEGVTESGSLRFTEFLPSETVLSSLVTLLPPAGFRSGASESGVLAVLDGALTGNAAAPQGETLSTIRGVLQLGADESKGKGLVRVSAHFPDGNAL